MTMRDSIHNVMGRLKMSKGPEAASSTIRQAYFQERKRSFSDSNTENIGGGTITVTGEWKNRGTVRPYATGS